MHKGTENRTLRRCEFQVPSVFLWDYFVDGGICSS